MPLIYVSSRQKEAAALKIKATASNARENMFIRHFTIDELARLVANIPDLTGEITKPYKECSIIESGEKTTYYLLCKGKRKLIKGKDDDKLKKYLEDYNSLVEKYKIEYT